MKPLKSIVGVILAALYAIAFIVAYVDYRNHVGQWFADTGLIFVALPFVLTMRFLSGALFPSGAPRRFASLLFRPEMQKLTTPQRRGKEPYHVGSPGTDRKPL